MRADTRLLQSVSWGLVTVLQAEHRAGQAPAGAQQGQQGAGGEIRGCAAGGTAAKGPGDQNSRLGEAGPTAASECHLGAPFTPPTKPLCREGTEQSLLGHLGSSLTAKILTAGHLGLLGLEPSAWTSLVTVMDSSRGMGAFSVVSIVLSALQALTQLILIVTQSGGCCYCL